MPGTFVTATFSACGPRGARHDGSPSRSSPGHSCPVGLFSSHGTAGDRNVVATLPASRWLLMWDTTKLSC